MEISKLLVSVCLSVLWIESHCLYLKTLPYHKNQIDSNSKLTAWSRVLLEKLTVSEPVKKFPAFHGKRKFVSAFRGACHRTNQVNALAPCFF
jgi:hypothetical protein